MAGTKDEQALLAQLQAENAQLKQQVEDLKNSPLAYLHTLGDQTHLSEILSDLPYYLCVLDEDLRFLYVNRLYGDKTFDEVMHQRIYKVFPKFFHGVIGEAVAEARSSNKTSDFAIESGEAYELRCQMQPIKGGEYWIFIVHDVGRENTNEKHLSKIQQRYVALNDNFPMAIIECDVHGKILQWSDGATKLFGYKKSEMLNQHLQKLSPSQNWSNKITQTFNDAKGGKDSVQLQIAVHHKDGHEIHCRWHVNVIFDTASKIDSFLIIGDDLTNEIDIRKNLEKAKEHAENLAEAKSNFIAAVSHELRTPMHGILNAAELLGIQVNHPKNKELASLISDSGDALLHVIDDVLNYSKLEAGKMPLNNAWVNLHNITKNVCNLMQGIVQEKQNTIQLISDVKNLNFYCDGGAVRQVLYNLIGNATKFTEQGSIDVFIHCQEGLENNADIVIEVKDTGIGIAQEKIGSVFKSFFQADETINSRFGGSGLGLSISKKIAMLMGGNITVNSEEGKGSCFALSFKAQMQQAEKELTKKQSLRNYRKTILVVDDNAINISISIRLLERLGCKVDVAVNGLEAFEKTLEKAYDVIFMDIQMPVLNGYEAAKKIKAQGLSKSTPIVAMSANKLDDEEIAVMTDSLNKPFNHEQLVCLLDKLF